ncbi:MAG TPA: sigma-70 family RNA polymerase sigma factor, partial [Gemmataceae bacterium]|nr:sigma-70 family RNA polymerase sigma factor [Gemmataceae bacterium]
IGVDMDSSASRDPERLLEQARAGEEAALGQILERYRNYLALLARLQIGRRLQAKVDAQDLVQEVFLQAHRHLAVFRGTTEAELARWLREILATVLANELRRYLRTKRRDVNLERDLAAEMEHSSRLMDRGLFAKQSSPSQQAARREEAVWLADLLGHLSEDHREVLILRHLEELSFPEIARRMDRSADAVKKLWARALIALRGSLEV